MDNNEREHGPEPDEDLADDFDEESLAAYIVDEIARAFAAHERAARGSVQRILPLGEMLALFNLADQFGLIDDVRADLDRRLDRNAYLAFSEAMKRALLDQGASPPPSGGGGRPALPPGPRGGRPPDRFRDDRDNRQGRQGQRDNRPPRGGDRPPQRGGRP